MQGYVQEVALPVTLGVPLTLQTSCDLFWGEQCQCSRTPDDCSEEHIRVTSWALSTTPQGVESFWYVLTVYQQLYKEGRSETLKMTQCTAGHLAVLPDLLPHPGNL